MSDNSLLEANRETHLFTQPHGLKLRTNGYEWLQNNKESAKIVEIAAKNVQKTFLENVSMICAVPSSKTSSNDIPLKDCAKERLKSRFDVSRHSSFDDAMITRQSCHIIEQVGKDYFCDCHEGIKGRLCKHSVGLMYKCGTLEITSDVRSKPLGQKRRPGRPKSRTVQSQELSVLFPEHCTYHLLILAFSKSQILSQQPHHPEYPTQVTKDLTSRQLTPLYLLYFCHQF